MQEAEAQAAAALPVLLFGAGHVGRALVLALAPLPVRVTWVDDRDERVSAACPANVEPHQLAIRRRAWPQRPPGRPSSSMTHSHALDLAIVAAALAARGVSPMSA